MASTVSGKGIDHYKWHRLLSEKASTIINGIDCYQKRHRPLKMASLVYERENCGGELLKEAQGEKKFKVHEGGKQERK